VVIIGQIEQGLIGGGRDTSLRSGRSRMRQRKEI